MKINTFKLSLMTLAVAACMGGASAQAADKEAIKIGAVTLIPYDSLERFIEARRASSPQLSHDR